jgi:ABC-type nitrate/sulfonate/bicarbonate transport system substrate-binding protein
VVPLVKIYDYCAKFFYINSWFATASWLQANQETARKLASAIYEAARWANTHHAESLQILAKYGKLDPAAAAHMNRALYDTTLDPAKVQPPLSLAWRYHGLAKELSAADLMAKV